MFDFRIEWGDQKCIQNPVKHLRWSFFAKRSILEVRLVSEYISGDVRMSAREPEQTENQFFLPYLIYMSPVLYCIYKSVICFAKQNKLLVSL